MLDRRLGIWLWALSLGANCGTELPPTTTPVAGEVARPTQAEAPAVTAKEAAEPSALRASPVASPPPGEDPSAAAEGPRLGALGPHTWIWRKAERSGLAIGKMRIGTSVRLRSDVPVDGPGCKGKWYAIEPRGFVCDDETATLDLSDPYFLALAYSQPKSGAWPYRYAHSNGAPMYGRVPTRQEWEVAEREYGPTGTWKPLGEWAKGHEENIVETPIEPTDEVPYFLRDGKRTAPGGNYNIQALVWKRIPPGSMLAYSKAFEANGRTWLLTPDTMVVPADRVSDMTRSEFHGIHLEEAGMSLPIAWNRAKAPLEIYRRSEGRFVPTGRTLGPKSGLEIQDGETKSEGNVYFELRRTPGEFVRRLDDPSKALDTPLVVTRAADKLPTGVTPEERWIQVHIISGTLTAYEGLTPVMATLFSPGKGGPPLPSYKFPDDHSKYATTALGNFPIEWKERVATMSNEKGEPKVLWFTDVPNQQYLKAPLAMHVAYWHQDFGYRKSAECVNVSPVDGDWLFGWTAPALPPGWNAIGAGQGNGESTPIIVSAK